MAEKVIIPLEAKVDKAIKDIESLKKEIKETGKESKKAKEETNLLTIANEKLSGTINGVKKGFKAAIGSLKNWKVALASTGIGLFVVALGTLAQYFRDSEEGASKLREITTQIGLVFGNVTDIASNFGKALYNLFTGDFKAMKDSLAEAQAQMIMFGMQTKEEMAIARQLEKDRLALQQFERKANVDKAKTEAKIMELRLQARDTEAFTNEERLAFMRDANKLADEQLAKDLHVANEKLRFQQIENSFSKSTKANLDAEAQLQAQVFQIQRSNFSERKRMKSEEQALVNAGLAQVKAEEKAKELAAKKEIDLAKKVADEKKKQADKEAKILEARKDAELKAYGQLAGALSSLAGNNKELAAASAIIDTYTGANKAFAQGGILGFVSAAAIVTAGLSNVKKIYKTKLPSGDGGGAGGGGSAPSVGSNIAAGLPTRANLDDVVGSVNNTNQQPVKAYVIGQDVTDSQEAKSYLDNQKTL
jgi:FtsZ-binding cell division protein ZapB